MTYQQEAEKKLAQQDHDNRVQLMMKCLEFKKRAELELDRVKKHVVDVKQAIKQIENGEDLNDIRLFM